MAAMLATFLQDALVVTPRRGQAGNHGSRGRCGPGDGRLRGRGPQGWLLPNERKRK